MYSECSQSPQFAKDHVAYLFKASFPGTPFDISPLSPAASPREYFRITTSSGSMVGAYGSNVIENELFAYVSKHLEHNGIRIPGVLAMSPDNKSYLLRDLGDVSLLDFVTRNRDTNLSAVEMMYQKVLVDLVNIQLSATVGFDFNKCLGRKVFDAKQVYWDLLYFKYYFVKLLEITFDEQALDDDFLSLASCVNTGEPMFFMYRDFQARNIMIVDNEPWYIDFQGVMRGPLQYDVASLLYQSRAGLPQDLRDRLLSFYIERLGQVIPVDTDQFVGTYHAVILARVLQNLGAYGFRGLIQKKETFVKSIPQAIDIAVSISRVMNMDSRFPELHKIINTLQSITF